MASLLRTIPVIDISSFVRAHDLRKNHLQQQEVVLEQWDKSFRDHGFAVIIGHGIPSQLICNLETAMVDFFGKTNQTDKNIFSHGSYGHPSGGYSPLFTEAVAQSNDDVTMKSQRSDPVESFVFTRSPRKFQLPSSSHSSADHGNIAVAHRLIECAATYYKSMEQLLYLLHQISARALGLPCEDYLNNYYTFDKEETNDDITMESSNILKLAFYPYITPTLENLESVNNDNRSTNRYGAHTDFQGFTILRPDPRDWTTPSSGGLEVLNSDRGEWLPVLLPSSSDIRLLLANGDDDGNASAEEFALVVNAGDLIQRWTNDRWISAVHRVSPGNVQGQCGNASGSIDVDGLVATTGRKACVFFSGPRDDTLVTMLPMDSTDNGFSCNTSDIDNDKEKGKMTAKYPPIRSGDHLQMKINKMQPKECVDG